MNKFDQHPGVILWNSEGLAIPYISPIDGQQHRYFPDFLIRVQLSSGITNTYLIEVKPHAQTELRVPKRQTRKFLNEVKTYAINNAKWYAAREFCKEQGWTFQIVTEKDYQFI